MESHMKSLTIAAALAASLAAGTANAQFYGKLGFANTNPSSDNGALAGLDASVDDAWDVTGGIGYRFTPAFFVDLTSGLSGANHEVKLDVLGDVASLDQLPINLSFAYQFLTDSKFRPYISAGYGWNLVSNEDTRGDLDGLAINVDDGSGFSWGVGADVFFNDNWFFRADVKWMDFDADVNIETLGDVGTAEVDPIVYDLSIGYQF
jgi:outer membrane protein